MRMNEETQEDWLDRRLRDAAPYIEDDGFTARVLRQLPAPQRSGGKRRYDARVLQLLRVIEVSKDAGFSLKEIEQLLHGFDRRTPPSVRWQALAQSKLREVDALIARAEGMRALLTRGLECGCLTLEDCRVLE